MSEPLVGLEDVVVATSTITYIDGAKGILRYRGYDVNELAEKSNYEEVAYLILFGQLPTENQLRDFVKQLRQNRTIPPEVIRILQQIPSRTEPIATLRTAVSVLASFDPEAEDNSEASTTRKTIRLTGQMGTLTTAIERLRHGQTPIEPDPTLDHASNFLYMLTGKKPDELSRRALDIALILQAEHELNASTFAARVTISTLSDMYSGITSAVGTLKGALHGGANQKVMEMLLKIDRVDRAESYIHELLAAKKKVMGFGHRVYTTVDPRAAILKKMSKELSQKVGPAKWYEMSELIERLMVGEKKINANLDFYSASVYQYLGIAIDLYPLIFATSRVVGWGTHLIEQYRNNRLIRPLTQYLGPQGLTYAPLSERRSVPPASAERS